MENAREKELEKALQEILFFKDNPIRRVQYAGCGDYAAPDWIQVKNKIFKIAERVLEQKHEE